MAQKFYVARMATGSLIIKMRLDSPIDFNGTERNELSFLNPIEDIIKLGLSSILAATLPMYDDLEADHQFDHLSELPCSEKEQKIAVCSKLLEFGAVEIDHYNVVEYHSTTRDVDDIKGEITSLYVVDEELKSVLPKMTATGFRDLLHKCLK